MFSLCHICKCCKVNISHTYKMFILHHMIQTEYFICHIYIYEAKWTFNISHKMFSLHHLHIYVIKWTFYVIYVYKWGKVIYHIIQNVQFVAMQSALCIIYIYMTQTEHFVCYIYINEAKLTFNISYTFSLCHICKWYKVNI